MIDHISIHMALVVPQGHHTLTQIGTNPASQAAAHAQKFCTFATLKTILKIGALVAAGNSSPASGVAIKGAIDRRRIHKCWMGYHNTGTKNFITNRDTFHVSVNIKQVIAGRQPISMTMKMAIPLQ